MSGRGPSGSRNVSSSGRSPSPWHSPHSSRKCGKLACAGSSSPRFSSSAYCRSSRLSTRQRFGSFRTHESAERCTPVSERRAPPASSPSCSSADTHVRSKSVRHQLLRQSRETRRGISRLLRTTSARTRPRSQGHIAV
ncbi:uncharacterized protein Tco025E_00078 [Trypanosoma conorhini]|uniref:Uncharacterized protein n=1 Tax=Trypanosoma conorhini TaxID=83891 RepID=A0A3R7LG10_9TRYP|nr:uncharacterized protein Tco025E_00078 [Trypanosoma conorhini]RNF27694.1 hypothetical protein Tco025E_00078 [Trypanosoma conorhini]